MSAFKYYLRLFTLPLSLLLIFLSLNLLWNIFSLPPADVLLEKVRGWFELYGLPVLFLSAILEGVLIVGGYFPGIFVIFVSVLLARSPLEAVIAVAVGTLGLLLAHALNYALGKHGWYRLLVKFGAQSSLEESKGKLEQRGGWAIFGSYWLPSLGALMDTAAGILQMPFRQFFRYSLQSSIFWNTLVGTTVYLLGEKALAITGSGGRTDIIIQISIVLVWIFILFALDLRKKRRAQSAIM